MTGTCARQAQDPSFDCPGSRLAVLSSSSLMAEPGAWRPGPHADFVVKASVFVFPIVAGTLSIPVFSIVMKYNMIMNGFSPRVGALWGVVSPWVIAFPLINMPGLVGMCINLAALIFVSIANFIVPLLVYMELQNREATPGTPEATAARSLARSLSEEDRRRCCACSGAYCPALHGGALLGATTKRRCAAAAIAITTAAAAWAAVLSVRETNWASSRQSCT